MYIGLHSFHKECVELWESLPPDSKLHPESWAYNHIVMSYVKDGMGILRWPKNESELKRRIKDIFLQCALLLDPPISYEPSTWVAVRFANH